MKVLIRQATIICSSSPFNGKVKDILIADGFINAIADNIKETADTIIEEKGLCLSIGWMDCFANFCDPGNEHKETLETGANAAAAGGYTEVMLIPNTFPAVHNKSQAEYIVQRSKNLAVTIHPIGSITKNIEGKELSEMYDMYNSGAIAFSDGINSLQSSSVTKFGLDKVFVHAFTDCNMRVLVNNSRR